MEREGAIQAVPLDGGHDYLTLAKVEILLVSSCTPSKRCPNHHDVKSTTVIRLDCFNPLLSDSLAHHAYASSISTSDGVKLFDCILQGSLDEEQLHIIHAAICLNQRSSNVKARSTFALSDVPAWPVESGNLESCSTTNVSNFLLTVRILVPNATSLLQNPGLPRTTDILRLFPSDSASNAKPWSPRDFYDHAYVPDRSASSEIPPMQELQCHLYPFQQRAVRWMLEREGALRTSFSSQDPHLPHGFKWVKDAEGRPCLVSRLMGLVSSDESILADSVEKRPGFILAEEMGLGKTVEVIALICAHKLQEDATRTKGPNELSPATLIITPPAILQQWIDELRILAPNLSVVTYDGMKAEGSRHDDADIMTKCSVHDVVLTTYPVLARDIYHAETPQKSLRHAKKYAKRISPLTQIKFWRCILDEAQMLESGVSNAAKVASLIPREFAWCVSGTPARNAKDLLGLLIFLKHEPYCSLPSLWDRLVRYHRDVLHTLFYAITLRHTKAQVKDEMQLPPQKRVVITLPFTGIEEQHYSSLFQQMAEECGLDLSGAPLRENWDPDDSQMVERMRTWLARLRQTCLHPEVGSRNRKALGGSKGPLRTVAEVLEVMIEHNDTAARSEERDLLLSRVRRGQILEHAHCTQEALDVWYECLEEVRKIVHECRQQLESELNKAALNDSEVLTDNEQAAVLMRAGPQRQRLRSALELEHMCTFFVANAHYQLKMKELTTEEQSTSESHEAHGRNAECDQLPDAKINSENEKIMSVRAKELEATEESFYDAAKLLRRELMTDASKNAILQIRKVNCSENDFPVVDPIKPFDGRGGIQSQQSLERLESLVATLTHQTEQVLAWRSKAIQLLTLPLVDTEEEELKGDEYETSTKQQDEVYVYVDALRALVSDRRTILTGQQNTLIEHEMNFIFREAKNGNGHSPELLISLLRQRHELKPKSEQTSFKGLITELRQFKNGLRIDVEGSNSRAAAESLITNSMLKYLHQVSTEQNKLTAALDKEVEVRQLTATFPPAIRFIPAVQARSLFTYSLFLLDWSHFR